ncbi:glycosyltransferase family 2 protein [Pelagibaculum spongiae]|uniref:Glycosyltransferase 2-like domain-containing protein n=1 Tax=Pelagibaculum spongiae TaxID=2080658 RepID=A0A2V1GX54_9GAMM|nr:glycosyltransferase family 2 protein [Pelagibaculum spongiae]PVZ70233.1 hypothetical protein DC094_06430 [Pelagibaculum spongiae]
MLELIKNHSIVYFDGVKATGNFPYCKIELTGKWDPVRFSQYDYIGADYLISPALLRRLKDTVPELYSLSSDALLKLAVEVSDSDPFYCSGVLVYSNQPAELPSPQAVEPGAQSALNLSHINHSMVSIVIPTRNGGGILKKCVDSILNKTSYKNYEIILIDNQSDDALTLSLLKQYSKLDKIRVLEYDRPFNYSAINNFAVEYANGSVLGLLNDDVEVISDDWLSHMLHWLSQPGSGCVGAKLLYPDGRIQHAGVITGVAGTANHEYKFYSHDYTGDGRRLQTTRRASAVTAACLLIKKSLYQQVGGLNEQHLPVAFNDVDLCLKVKLAGYHNIWVAEAVLYHHESVSRGKDVTPQQKARARGEVAYMRQQWQTHKQVDAYWHPWLSGKSTSPKISWVNVFKAGVPKLINLPSIRKKLYAEIF